MLLWVEKWILHSSHLQPVFGEGHLSVVSDAKKNTDGYNRCFQSNLIHSQAFKLLVAGHLG